MIPLIRKWLLFGPILLFTLAACSPSAQPLALAPGEPTPVVVRILDLDAALQVTSTTPPTFTPLPTLPPTNTASPANGVTTLAENPPTFTPTPSCRNAAEFVKMLNGSSNVALKTGDFFAMIWQIRNAGDCIWNEGYSLVLVGGEAMNAPVQLPLNQQVNPGETVDVRVDIVAPNTPGAYSGSWQLQAPDGTRFGIGPEGVEPLLVSINVQPQPRPTPG